MGYIKLEYTCSPCVNKNHILNELEYGNTFIVNQNGEKLISIPGEVFEWVSIDIINDSNFYLIVKDDFFEIEYFFEKILTTFVYNFLDFGVICLEDIDINNSELNLLNDNIKDIKTMPFNNLPVLGTIFKPYYHFNYIDKLHFISHLSSLGIDLIKDDETYLIGKNKILSDSKKIQLLMGKKSFYIPNITPFIEDVDFVSSLINNNIRIVMVNFIVTGFGPIKRLKKQFPDLKIWGHRVGFDVLKKYYIKKSYKQISCSIGYRFSSPWNYRR